ncbi:MAG: TetR/AcrR family transcriptional regulator [Actinomycetota bacterium]|nr:TetR/AcrR family transcriptional regulator [Actinomycetota bacterium]
MLEPPTTRGRATKQRIVSAAAALFHERGVSATSVEHVLAAAGSGKGQFYRYFSSKDDLLRAVLGHHIEQELGLGRPLVEELDDWPGIEAYFEAIVAGQEARGLVGGCPIGSLALELADRDEALRRDLAAAFARWQGRIEQGLARMKENGTLRPDADPAWLATVTLASIQGGYLLATTHKDLGPLRAALEAARGTIAAFAAEEGPDGDPSA